MSGTCFANNQNTVLAFCSPDMHAGFASPAGHCACSQNHIFKETCHTEGHPACHLRCTPASLRQSRSPAKHQAFCVWTPSCGVASVEHCKQVRGCAEGPRDRASEKILSGVAVLGFADTFLQKASQRNRMHLISHHLMYISLAQKMQLSSCEGNGIHEGKSGPIAAESWHERTRLCRQGTNIGALQEHIFDALVKL